MKNADSGERSKNRAYSAAQRGWISGDALEDSLKEGASSLAALKEKGLLDASRLARLLGGELLPGVAVEAGVSDEEPYHAGDLLAGKFRVFGLAEGGFGRVLFCEHMETGGRFALKTLRRFYLRDPEMVRRFSAEARRWLGLGAHPHIVRCHGVEEIARQPFLMMEFVEGGRTLLDEMADSPPDWRRTLRTGLQVAQALAFCERAAGLVHGDIKPLNILITPDGDAKLTDLGISYARLHETDETPQAGTPGYCAPELLEGVRRSTATDIYAYGITLWQGATGCLPRADDPMTGRKEDLAVAAPGMIPPTFAKLIMACVEDAPEGRPALSFAQIAGELKEAHERLIGDTSLYTPSDFNLADHAGAAVNAYNLADTLLAMGKPGEALELARRAVGLDAAYWRGHDAMGRALLGLQRYAEAGGCLAAAIGLNPDDPLLHAALAEVRWNLGEEKPARESLARAISLARERNNIGCLDFASAIIAQILSPQEALAIHDEITRSNPTAARSWVNRTALLRELERDAEALESARKAVDLNPSNAMTWGVLSGALSDMEQYGEALEAVERALAYDSTDPALHGQKVVALYRSGREAEAISQLKNALAVWPDSVELRRLAGLE